MRFQQSQIEVVDVNCLVEHQDMKTIVHGYIGRFELDQFGRSAKSAAGVGWRWRRMIKSRRPVVGPDGFSEANLFGG